MQPLKIKNDFVATVLFFLIGIHFMQQPLQGMELQEKEKQKD